ncbi:kinase-like domain-containing protein [Nemania sp. FL0916]|nr:kinase-like domain-containing protein [Nemania sp. FL0916]
MIKVHTARPLYVPENDRIKFIYTRVVFSQDNKMFSGHSQNKNVGSEIHMDELEDIQHISEDIYAPLMPVGSTIAPSLPADRCYIKRPDVFRIVAKPGEFSPVLQELEVCELIRRHPHPNIATYYGCQSANGRVTGLSFERYLFTLLDKLNPDALNKSEFMSSSDRNVTREFADRYLPGIEAGLRHLHALGLVHNDLNPNNIMIAEDDRPVIIDFDSCRAIGADVRTVRRTFQWFDPDVHVAAETNDLDALEEIRIWLAGSTPDDFKFGR